MISSSVSSSQWFDCAILVTLALPMMRLWPIVLSFKDQGLCIASFQMRWEFLTKVLCLAFMIPPRSYMYEAHYWVSHSVSKSVPDCDCKEICIQIQDREEFMRQAVTSLKRRLMCKLVIKSPCCLPKCTNIHQMVIWWGEVYDLSSGSHLLVTDQCKSFQFVFYCLLSIAYQMFFSQEVQFWWALIVMTLRCSALVLKVGPSALVVSENWFQ